MWVGGTFKNMWVEPDEQVYAELPSLRPLELIVRNNFPQHRMLSSKTTLAVASTALGEDVSGFCCPPPIPQIHILIHPPLPLFLYQILDILGKQRILPAE